MKKRLLAREKGQGLVEYALIIVLVAIVVIVALTVLGPLVGNVFSGISDSLLTGGGGGGGEGGGGGISASASATLTTLTINITVPSSTSVTVSGDVSGGPITCDGSCSFTFTGGFPPSGSATVSAASGGSQSVSW